MKYEYQCDEHGRRVLRDYPMGEAPEELTAPCDDFVEPRCRFRRVYSTQPPLGGDTPTHHG